MRVAKGKSGHSYSKICWSHLFLLCSMSCWSRIIKNDINRCIFDKGSFLFPAILPQEECCISIFFHFFLFLPPVHKLRVFWKYWASRSHDVLIYIAQGHTIQKWEILGPFTFYCFNNLVMGIYSIFKAFCSVFNLVLCWLLFSMQWSYKEPASWWCTISGNYNLFSCTFELLFWSFFSLTILAS